MTSLDIEVMARLAAQLVEISTKLPSNLAPQRAGGYLTIGLDRLQTVHSIFIGNVPHLKNQELYRRYSREKTYRLEADWLRDELIFSSWHTRDEAINRYGGAVLFPTDLQALGGNHHIVSFSGLKEHVDEAVSLALGSIIGISSEEHARRVVEVSRNPVFLEMLKAYNER